MTARLRVYIASGAAAAVAGCTRGRREPNRVGRAAAAIARSLHPYTITKKSRDGKRTWGV